MMNELTIVVYLAIVTVVGLMGVGAVVLGKIEGRGGWFR
jgi:hypothetical protein